MNDSVSIIIPVHNNKATIKRCLDSVLVQDAPSLELIVIVFIMKLFAKGGFFFFAQTSLTKSRGRIFNEVRFLWL